jgi:hypothetical protein
MCRDEYDFVGQDVYNGSGESPTLTIVATPISLTGHATFGKGVTLRNTSWYVAVYNGLSGTEPLVRARCLLTRHPTREHSLNSTMACRWIRYGTMTLYGSSFWMS